MRLRFCSAFLILPWVAASFSAHAEPGERTIYDFKGIVGADGWSPKGTLIRDAAGNLFGTTTFGGIATAANVDGAGTVFELSPPSAGQSSWTSTILYSFGTKTFDGLIPNAGVTADANGNLFLTTTQTLGYLGGRKGGTVIELSPPVAGQTVWSERILHAFGRTLGDGYQPDGNIFIDNRGNLYTTTYYGGAYNGGTVVKLTPDLSGGYREKVIYSFGGTLNDGTHPAAGLSIGPGHTLVTSTSTGGKYGAGAVVTLSPPVSFATPWTENVVYSFKGTPDGLNPQSVVTADGSGYYYTLAYQGGASPDQFSAGALIQLHPPSNGVGPWAESVIHSFGLGTDGSFPYGNVLIDASGTVYATASMGGSENGGVVAKFSRPLSGSDWPETIVHNFGTTHQDGADPYTGLTADHAGNLYTVTLAGGPYDRQNGYSYGTVVKIIGSGFAPF